MTRANSLSKVDDSTAVFPHCHAPVEAPAPASLGTRGVMPRMSNTLTVSKLANQQTESLTSPQYMQTSNKHWGLNCASHIIQQDDSWQFSSQEPEHQLSLTMLQLNQTSIKTPIQNEPALAVWCFALLSYKQISVSQITPMWNQPTWFHGGVIAQNFTC